TALMLFVFYTIYISAGVVGMGILLQSILGINYQLSTLIGLCLIIPYLLAGGYLTLAWTDLFQALFLLIAIVSVPLIAFKGWSPIEQALTHQHLSSSFFPDFSGHTLLTIFFALTSWGLGYFGQPHIVTKFMGIRDPKQIYKAKYVGMTWQILTFAGAVLIGLEGVAYFQHLKDPETVFINIADLLLHPFVAGLMLCGVLAASISTINSQILVLASSLSEDFYKRIWRKNASSKEVLWASRVFIVFAASLAYLIAAFRINTIYELVFFAWAGLGASFGPIMIASLFAKKINKYGAFAAILTGGLTAGFWPLTTSSIPTLLIGFVLSFIAMWCVSKLTWRWHKHEVVHFD
ncbi:MAG TPA: sodium/proline symporter, partial [Chlamydiales bacterium]|nr:sodium/proline symporter [Chlamydiales bacterium]